MVLLDENPENREADKTIDPYWSAPTSRTHYDPDP